MPQENNQPTEIIEETFQFSDQFAGFIYDYNCNEKSCLNTICYIEKQNKSWMEIKTDWEGINNLNYKNLSNETTVPLWATFIHSELRHFKNGYMQNKTINITGWCPYHRCYQHYMLTKGERWHCYSFGIFDGIDIQETWIYPDDQAPIPDSWGYGGYCGVEDTMNCPIDYEVQA